MTTPTKPALGFCRNRFIHFVLLASIISLIGYFVLQHNDRVGRVKSKWLSGVQIPELPPILRREHPIDKLIADSRRELHALLSRETNNVAAGAEEYRKRRGRHPPPGFGEWYLFAQSHDALMVEDFFDQIYHDLTPFWGVNASVIRQQAKTRPHLVSVRNGSASWKSDFDRQWVIQWHDLVDTIAEFLPDLDMPVNVMDESRLIVPWEEVTEKVSIERNTRHLASENEVITSYTGLADVDANPGEPLDAQYLGGPYWDRVRVGCPPDSPGRNAPLVTDFSGPGPLPTTYLSHTHEGYVANWTASKDVCYQPHLRELHGSFVEPISISTSHHLLPLFGGSKLPQNNDILIPPAMYWAKDPQYSGGDSLGPKWSAKKNALIWRGVASGGRNRAENWTRFQRHRFVSMMNGTSVRLAETSQTPPPNFDLPGAGMYKTEAGRKDLLGDWVGSFADAAFIDLICHPQEERHKCPYSEQYYEVADMTPMQYQYKYKYLPDIDGNSFSGRYRGFLRSYSLPIKATVYSEWHDSRLVAWQHFVPMDNTFVDIYGIMDYFLGNPKGGRVKNMVLKPGHDEEAKRIAEEGSRWAEKVLRREDMQIYMYRLLLEFARLCDDNRDMMGWVDDLLDTRSLGR